jgi:hypothetical protein
MLVGVDGLRHESAFPGRNAIALPRRQLLPLPRRRTRLFPWHRTEADGRQRKTDGRQRKALLRCSRQWQDQHTKDEAEFSHSFHCSSGAGGPDVSRIVPAQPEAGQKKYCRAPGPGITSAQGARLRLAGRIWRRLAMISPEKWRWPPPHPRGDARGIGPAAVRRSGRD